MQQRLQLLVGGEIGLDEYRPVIGAPIHAVQHQTMQVYVQVGRRAEALDQRDRAAVGFVGLEACLVEQVARDQAVHHLQHRRHQHQLCRQQQAAAGLAVKAPTGAPARAG